MDLLAELVATFLTGNHRRMLLTLLLTALLAVFAILMFVP